MANIATYILAPNFSYHPNTSICIGDIVQYPDDPTKPLSSVPDAEISGKTESHFDYDNELSSQNSFSLRGSIWANFLEKATAKIDGGKSDELLTKYTVRRLETVYFKKQPTDTEAAKRIESSNDVSAAINSGLLGKKPVFMITGLKIARGFTVSRLIESQSDAAGKPGAPIADDVEVGMDVSYHHKKGLDQKHRSGQDIVFAYQLHMITHKGWFHKAVDITVYRSPASFLNEEEKGRVDAEPIVVAEVDECILRDSDNELEMEAVSAEDGGKDCRCIMFCQN
ncbi:uncharacterized protein BBA_07460 [Beauveria bassiana ARSEF 2860]|uniref:Uncharacterized protein n=1 Tax=Beauveria bassiana (strain ARSEF 2860) TaxID=655819 RepID=J4KM89_BEAB2|nr:uncharacterized protein BBA_07460 [Beauveria bassiana ARSEF 2860]EJP63534.1 hypothetical protein BBA_07460 [Beauveria bassiana ARSEF 2860]